MQPVIKHTIIRKDGRKLIHVIIPASQRDATKTIADIQIFVNSIIVKFNWSTMALLLDSSDVRIPVSNMSCNSLATGSPPSIPGAMRFYPRFRMSKMLPVLVILFFAFMPGNSHAINEPLPSDPALERHLSQQVTADWNIRYKSDDETSAEENDTGFSQTDCSYHNPRLNITPSGAQWANPGTPVEFTVIVTNTSSTFCNPTNFDLSTSAPPGWDISLDRETLQVPPDWATGIVTMVVTSPDTVGNGSHEITVTAGNTLLSMKSSATATYVIDSDNTEVACITRKPVVIIVPATNSVYTGNPVDYTILVTNQDSMQCMVSTFTITPILSAGLAGTLTPSTLNLLPDETGSIVLSVEPETGATPGTYNIEIIASDSGNDLHSVRASTDFTAEFTVADNCIPTTPSLSLTPAGTSDNHDGILSYTITLSNNDSPVCEDSTFDLSITFLPPGWKGKLSSKQVVLSPGMTSQSTLTVTPAISAQAGTYRLQIGATDALSLQHTKSTMARDFIDGSSNNSPGSKSPSQGQESSTGVAPALINLNSYPHVNSMF